jgi:hypothetical protein
LKITNGSFTFETNGSAELAVIALAVSVAGIVAIKVVDNVIHPLVKRVDFPEVLKSLNFNFPGKKIKATES